jgi:hypothetical protein
MIEPVHGARSKTQLYRVFHMLAKPLLPVVRRVFPASVLTTAEIGQAMLWVAKHGYAKRVLESWDIRAVMRQTGSLNTQS